MWYFTRILGSVLACSFSVLNAKWFELRSDEERDRREVLEGD
jgi:cyd operon protein YbgT